MAENHSDMGCDILYESTSIGKSTPVSYNSLQKLRMNVAEALSDPINPNFSHEFLSFLHYHTYSNSQLLYPVLEKNSIKVSSSQIFDDKQHPIQTRISTTSTTKPNTASTPHPQLDARTQNAATEISQSQTTTPSTSWIPQRQPRIKSPTIINCKYIPCLHSFHCTAPHRFIFFATSSQRSSLLPSINASKSWRIAPHI